jgi:hypothetical protein
VATPAVRAPAIPPRIGGFSVNGEGRAERLVESRDGFLILQSIPGRRNTGAIYLYREQLGAFFWLSLASVRTT